MPTPESLESNPVLAAVARMLMGGFGGSPALMPGHAAAGVSPQTTPPNPLTQSVTSSYAPSGTSFTPPKPRVVYQENPDGQTGMGTPDAGSDPYYNQDTPRTDRQVYRESSFYQDIQSYL